MLARPDTQLTVLFAVLRGVTRNSENWFGLLSAFRELGVLRTPAMDPEEQAEIQGWLEDVLGSPFPMGSTFEDCLASGARLCQLMNSLWYGNTEVVRERLNRLLFS